MESTKTLSPCACSARSLTRPAHSLNAAQSFLNALAADHKIPARLLVDNGEMVELLRGQFEDLDSLRDSEILEQRVVALIGEDLVAILNGRRGLRLVNGVATQLEG